MKSEENANDSFPFETQSLPLKPNKLYCFSCGALEEPVFLFLFKTKEIALKAITESSIVPKDEATSAKQAYNSAAAEARFWGDQYSTQIFLIKEERPFLILDEAITKIIGAQNHREHRMVQKILYEEKIGYISLVNHFDYLPFTEKTIDNIAKKKLKRCRDLI